MRQDARPIDLPAQNLTMHSEMWAVAVSEPRFVLLVAPGVGAYRFADQAFNRRIGGSRKRIAARKRGLLIDADHLIYDATAPSARTGTDAIGRPTLAINAAILAGWFRHCGDIHDLFRSMDMLFAYTVDADRAANDVAGMARRCGGEVLIG